MILRKKLIVGLIIVLPIVLFPTLQRTLFSTFLQSFIDLIRGKHYLTSVLTPRAGTWIYPNEVKLMLDLLNEYQAKSYRCSNLIKKNLEIYQRLVEGAYPIQYSESSDIMFLFAKEQIPPNCRNLKVSKEVQIASCN